MTKDRMSVVVSGSSWMGGGFGSIESALRDLFALANDEVVIVAYAISGAAPALFQQIELLLERGVRVRMLINRYNEQHESVQTALSKLQARSGQLLRIFSFLPQYEEADLHAKIVLVDRRYALVGSANLSLRGLMDNHEIALRVEGSAVADITRAIDLLFNSTQVLPIKLF